MEEEGIDIALRHCCNSAAVLELPEYYCDMVRPGIIMYGCEPSPEIDITPYDLRPVMSLRCCIAHVKLIDAGATVSYGRHYTAPDRRKIATLPVAMPMGIPAFCRVRSTSSITATASLRSGPSAWTSA